MLYSLQSISCSEETMKDILVLLFLLSTQTIKVWSQPYKPHIEGQCVNPEKEYLVNQLCCKKCAPGWKLNQTCSETTDTVCEPCPRGQFQQGWNYHSKCFRCTQCKPAKGLQYAESCSPTGNSRCVCKPGTYCIMGFDDPLCAECSAYRRCKVGHGVSVPGTRNSNVKCEPCPDGTFSDTVSHTDHCRPHTDCQGRAVVKQGDANSDTICEPDITPKTPSKDPHTQTVLTTASTVMSKVFTTTDSEAPPEQTDSTSAINPSVSEAVLNPSTTKSPPPNTEFNSKLALTISIVMASIFLLVVILLLLIKQLWKKDTRKFYPKVDANGNCQNGDIVKINQGYLDETQLVSLLEKGEGCSNQSQCSTNTETLTRDGCSSFESIGPLQSTEPPPSSHPALSEPMPLLSHTEPVAAQSSISTQSSQPTSPQIISPVTTSPHVNVNITFHIGNGSGGTPSVVPTDLIKADSQLPFGEKEESFSIPQQENGKQSLMSVQESESYSALTDTTMKDTTP